MSTFVSRVDDLRKLARAAAPRECVGLLLEAEPFVWPLSNVDPRPEQGFALDPLEVAEVLSLGHTVLGLFHSHPRGGGRPSLRDHNEFLSEGWYYCILEGPHWRFWNYRWMQGRWSECESGF